MVTGFLLKQAQHLLTIHEEINTKLNLVEPKYKGSKQRESKREREVTKEFVFDLRG